MILELYSSIMPFQKKHRDTSGRKDTFRKFPNLEESNSLSFFQQKKFVKLEIISYNNKTHFCNRNCELVSQFEKV